MNDKKIQNELKVLEDELRDLKVSMTFFGNISCYQYEFYNSAAKVRIYYDNPSQLPITTIVLSDYDIMKILGPYDTTTKSQVAYFSKPHNILLLTSTQPILRVENVA